MRRRSSRRATIVAECVGVVDPSEAAPKAGCTGAERRKGKPVARERIAKNKKAVIIKAARERKLFLPSFHFRLRTRAEDFDIETSTERVYRVRIRAGDYPRFN